MSRRILAALLLVAGAVLGTTAPAHAAASVSVSGPDGSATAAPDTATTVTVSGRGFTSIKAGFGGIYVAFGWVADASGGSWRPSRGGITGEDYRYVPDAEGRENAGRLRYVAFPGSSTAGEANGGTLSEAGDFRVQLTIPGAQFTSTDRDGATIAVDCSEVQCGVITFGAHGVANADNETFTPVRFAAATSGPSPSQTTVEPDAAQPTAAATPQAPGARPVTTVPDGEIRVSIDAATTMAGRVMTFTAVGLRPGEQVLVRLDDGVAAAGPFTAGANGDVAGMLELPGDLAAGTHELHLAAAASGRATTTNFAVRAGDAADDAEVAPVASGASDGGEIAGWIFLGASGAVLVGVLVWRLLALRRGRTTRVAR